MITTVDKPDIPATDEEKIHMLESVRDDFAKSLYQQFQHRGSLSPKQWYYVDEILLRQASPIPAEVDADKLHGLMTAATQKFPKIRMSGDFGKLVISRAGPNSRLPGSLNLTDGRPFGDNQWYGRIVDGIFQTSKNCPMWVVEIVRALEENPEETAANYGKLSGNCCFCGRDLEDIRSTSIGYGPICADKWGLAWGAVDRASDTHEKDPGEVKEVPREEAHDCWKNAVLYSLDGLVGDGFKCARCGAVLTA